MAYASVMNLNLMVSCGAPAPSYGPAYGPPGQTNMLALYSAYAASSAQYAQTSSAQMLQSLVSLQANWSALLGSSPQMAMPGGYSSGSSYDAYAAYYQQYCATYQPQAPAYQAPVNVAAAVNVETPPATVETPPATVEVAASSGGDGGGGDGGDPVILDLNGDNKLDVTGADGGKINFNLFGNGTNVKTEWLKAGTQDGLLVSDFDGDGKIDSGRELMRTTGVNGEQGKYKGGWDKLSQLFDKNQDGKVSGNELNELKVWVDKDGDGVSDEGELRSVKELGISQIDIPGQGVKSNFTMNGRQQMAEDYVFDLAK